MIDDLSAFIIAGRVKAEPKGQFETDERSPAQGIADGAEAEEIGFRRIWISERWNLKDASVILGGVGARTKEIGLATGLITPASRHPLQAAAMGSTFTAAFGDRVVLGFGRGDDPILNPIGLHKYRFDALVDYMNILKRLWAGETVSYDGPVGKWDRLAMGDIHEGVRPEVWYGTFGLPRAAKAAAECMDGVLLVPTMTPEATHEAVTRIREACEAIDRDPASIRIAQCVVTAPDLDELETFQIVHGRAYTYLQAPGYAQALCRLNHWDEEIIKTLSDHKQMHNVQFADEAFHRKDLVEPAKLIPEEWMKASNAYGSVDECLAKLQEFRDAGADEVVTYGSTPGQNAKLAEAWAARAKAPA